MDACLRVTVNFDQDTIKLLYSIGKAKADWFAKNNWNTNLNRLIRAGLSLNEAQHFQQFLGLAGEAAVWQWLWGDLLEFWKQQAFLHESKALSDGGQDMPGLDVKTRDLFYHDHHSQPDLLLTPSGINPDVSYVLCVALISQPVVPVELDVVIAGAISGQAVKNNMVEWFDQQLKRTVISQSLLTPVEVLKWNEHQINRGKYD